MRFDEPKSIYFQIADDICNKILRKEWVESDRIPSARELAGRIGVNPNTIIRSYKSLHKRGIITNCRGVGYYVTALAYKIVKEERKRLFWERLPDLFLDMEELSLSWEDIEKKYRDHKEKQSEKK